MEQRPGKGARHVKVWSNWWVRSTEEAACSFIVQSLREVRSGVVDKSGVEDFDLAPDATARDRG